MEQHAEVTLQIFSFVESKPVTLFKTSKNDLKTLLDALGKQFSGTCGLGRRRK